MTRLALTFIGIAALWLTGQVAVAQDIPKPGPEHELFNEFVGTWDAVVKFGEQESKGESVYKLALGGMWLISDFSGEFGGAKFQGHGIDGFDPDKKKYTGMWIDSMTPTAMLSEGTYDKASKKLTLHGESKGPDGKPTKMRSVTTLKSKDIHVFEMFTTGSDGKEQLMMTIQYTRRK